MPYLLPANISMNKTPIARRGLVTRCFLPAVFAAIFAGLAPSAIAADAAANGIVRGQVSNGFTHANLDGVRVKIAELGREVLTDHAGNYEISGVPAGTYVVSFDYPGLDAQRATVQLEAGGQVQQDVKLTSSVYVLEKFSVDAVREGNAAAIVAQRNAVNVQNIVTADAFGSIAKGNVGNFLRRLPGIAGTTDEIDTENIILRGMPAEFTTMDIDGARYASGGTGRNQSALSVPTDMIERVEVVKAPLPENEADSLGGRVNMITKSAFDRQGRLLTYRAGDSYSFTYGNAVGRHRPSSFAPSFEASYGEAFSVLGGRNNLGIYTSANWERILDVRGTTAWDNTTTVSGVEYPRFNNGSIALHGVDRGGTTLRVDYKLGPDAMIGTQLMYNTYTNDMYRTRNQIKNGTVRPALSTPDYMFTVIDGANYATERSDRHQPQNRIAARVYGKYRTSGDIKLDADFQAQRTTQRNYTTFYNATSARKFNYVLDRVTFDPRWPSIRMTSGFYTGNTTTTTALPSTYLDLNPFSDDFSNTSSTSGLQFQRIFSKNEIVTAKANATKDLNFRWPIELKTGVSYRGETVKSSRDDLRGQINLATTGYGPDLHLLNDSNWDLGGAIGRYPVGTTADLDKVISALGIAYAGPNNDPIARWNYNPKTFSIDTNSTRQNTLQNTRKIFERIYGTYAQGSIKIGRFSLLTGVRFEQTEDTREQPVRNRSLAGTLGEWTTRGWTDGSYNDYFPSAHARYAISPNLIAHASYSTTSGRPNWSNILGVTDSDDTKHTLNIPNIDLKPRTSTNCDVSLEYYFEPVGVISIGAFRKEIKNYDVTTSYIISAAEAADLGAQPAPGDDTPYLVSTKLNAGDGLVRGLELNYSQSLSFLPGYFRGLGVFANFTYLKTTGTFDNLGVAGLPPVKTDKLEKFIPRTANAGLSYVYNRVDVRASWNFTDDWSENTPTDPSTTKIRGSRWSIDLSSKYKLSRRISLFADLVNLTTNHGKKYRGWVASNRRVETNALGFIVTAGVQGSF
jgi:iron complex outermembrane recepter protein